jgi:apolipoprotein D and lipocalin family protein
MSSIMIKKILFFVCTILGISSCGSDYPFLKTVANVDIDRYVGKWYEIASFPQSFQKGCNCTTAEYFKTEEDYVRVVNSCRKDSPQGELKTANGKAFIVEGTNNTKLKVQFFWPFKGDYWIIDLADDYSYAVVGHPNREYLWILSRTPKMDKNIYDGILSRVTAQGFDINKLKITDQSCN